MAYQTPWRPREAEACKRDAEERAGLSPLGYLYRLEEVWYSTVIDADREEYGSRLALELRACPIRRRTPKGWRLFNGRFVLEPATKRWACPTLEEAVESFVARKTKQARIYESRARIALVLIDMARPTVFADLMAPA